MRKLTTTLAISLLCLTVFSQKVTTNLPIKEDIRNQTSGEVQVLPQNTPSFSDSTAITLKQIERILQTKKSVLSVSDWELFYAILNRFVIPELIKEFDSKQKPSPAKK
jgi:hypothetical protein